MISMMRIIPAAAALLLSGFLQTSATRPRFEVAAIKSCANAAPGERGGGPTAFSPDRVAVNCQILKGLIQQAYVAHADGRTDQYAVLRTPIEGGPDWITYERYSINAKAPAETTQAMMMGPLLQTLLEDRFKLQIRRLTREIPMCDLVVAKGGPTLTPFQEGSCVAVAVTFPPSPPRALAPGEKRCLNRTILKGPTAVLDAEGLTISDLVRFHLFVAAGRPVNDKTGLTGKFDFHMEYAPESNGQRLVVNRSEEHTSELQSRGHLV